MGEYSAVLTAMFESEEQIKRIEVIIMLLAKLYAVLELSPDVCPVCRATLLDTEQQHDARTAIRAVALSIGFDDSFADPVTH